MTSKVYQIIILSILTIVQIKFMFRPIWKTLKETIWLKRYGIKAKGTVVDFTEKIDLDNLKTFAPVIMFKDYLGNSRKFSSKIYRMEKPAIGKCFEVIYDKENPEFAEIKIIGTIIFSIFILLLLIGISISLWIGIFFFKSNVLKNDF
jgi:hypothetical protein